MVYGQWPTEDIDHIDGNRANNRVENLRAVSRSVNMRNAYRRKDNKSGFVGVHKNRVGSWVAQIAVDGRVIHLGFFRAQGDAVAARKAAEIEHGFSVRHGCEAI